MTTGDSAAAGEDRSPEARLDGFIAAYTPEIGAVAREALARLRARLPGAVELVYDSYNALAIGIGPTERTSEAIFSLALFPRRVSLFFMHGAALPDPERLLRGSGNQSRHLVLEAASDLDRPAVQALITRALERAKPIDATRPGRVIIKSVSAKQRPRRPS